jgi:starch synthase
LSPVLKSKDIKVLMVASENDALPKCKVGGIGDVIRELPAALLRQGYGVSVVIPSYGFLHNQLGIVKPVKKIKFLFSNLRHEAIYYRHIDSSGVVNYIIDCPDFYNGFSSGDEKKIYCDDPPDAPFATDATKFAFFSRAVAEGLKNKVFGKITTIHLHDWHMAFLLILREFHQDYKELKKYQTVFTIHNLAFQGIRPFQGHSSSLKEWYPDLFKFDRALLADARWQDCINPMAAGIRLADAVNTVSPTYAKEILKPSDPPFYYGGDGLESDLLKVQKKGKLFGILNGCDYKLKKQMPVYHFSVLLKYFKNVVKGWAAESEYLKSSHYFTLEKLNSINADDYKDPVILTSVGRVVDQKFYLLKAKGLNNFTAMQGILEALKGRGVYVVLGTGNREYESFLIEMSLKHENFIFLNGYSNECSDILYANGHLFLMPSSYEPCGISQLYAMREGQPCVVHGVGGLNDTVKDNENGFVFYGDTVEDKVDNFVDKCIAAVDMKENNVSEWCDICGSAQKTKFTWDKSVKEYIERIYR